MGRHAGRIRGTVVVIAVRLNVWDGMREGRGT